MRYDLPVNERIVGLDPATGAPATAIVVRLGDDTLTITISTAAAVLAVGPRTFDSALITFDANTHTFDEAA